MRNFILACGFLLGLALQAPARAGPLLPVDISVAGNDARRRQPACGWTGTCPNVAVRPAPPVHSRHPPFAPR